MRSNMTAICTPARWGQLGVVICKVSNALFIYPVITSIACFPVPCVCFRNTVLKLSTGDLRGPGSKQKPTVPKVTTSDFGWHRLFRSSQNKNPPTIPFYTLSVRQCGTTALNRIKVRKYIAVCIFVFIFFYEEESPPEKAIFTAFP